MKANELRIGNYVNVPREDQSPFRIDAFEYLSNKYIKVAMIHPEYGENFHPLTWNGDDIKPIPLTEEWLLKFGFEENKNYEHTSFDEYVIDDFGIGNYNDQYWIIDFLDQSIGSPEIKHVHQLQNLYFALTSEELEIKNE